LGGGSNTNSGFESASLGGYSNANSGNYSASTGGANSCNSGARASVHGGQYYENIDDNCVCGGYGAAAPADFGDGRTNKNIKWKLHNDTGNAEFVGDVQVEGKLKNAASADVVFDDGVEVEADLTVGGNLNLVIDEDSGTCDWASSAEFIESSALVSYVSGPLYELTVVVSNSDNPGTHDIDPGSTILLDWTPPAGRTLISGHVKNTAGTTNAQKGARWSVGETLDVADADASKIAVTYVGKTTITMAANAADSLTLKVYLLYTETTT